MGFAVLSRRSAEVRVGGKLYVCRPASAMTLHRALVLYSEEVEVAGVMESPGDGEIAPIVVATVSADTRRAISVLSTCVSPEPEPGHVEACARPWPT